MGGKKQLNIETTNFFVGTVVHASKTGAPEALQIRLYIAAHLKQLVYVENQKDIKGHHLMIL